MYISKAMLNMRGDALGSTANANVEAPWRPYVQAAFGQAGIQSSASAIGVEAAAAVVFSTGDTITDTVWNNQALSLFSLNTLRAYLTANLPGCVMDAAFISTGTVRIVNLGQGKRMLDTLSLLGRLSYAKPFNRMYILLNTGSAVGAVSSAVYASVIEFTPQDLVSMGAPLTDNGDGTFSLNGTICLNNIAWS